MDHRVRLAIALSLGGLLLGSAGAGIAVAADPSQAAATVVPTSGVVAFYFHGNSRCATCRQIESYADEAIRTGFAEALAKGNLAWRVVNLDAEENQHFVEDFQLTTRSVVLAEYRDGKVVRFKSLDKVWQLVRSKEQFVDYVQTETRTFLAAS